MAVDSGKQALRTRERPSRSRAGLPPCRRAAAAERQMPLNVFEPRYLAMIDAAIAGDRLIGMIQPAFDAPRQAMAPPLCEVGCLGRITQFSETGDGRYAIALGGVSRFRVFEEVTAITPYRQCVISVEIFHRPRRAALGEEAVDRSALLRTFRDYLQRERAGRRLGQRQPRLQCRPCHRALHDEPWGPPEKQALLKSPDHATRARTLITITEMALAGANAPSAPLQ